MLDKFLTGFKVPAKLYWDKVYENIIAVQQTQRELNIDYWSTYTIGRWYWWFLLLWAVFPIIIWWIFADRKRFLEVSFFGVIVSISAGILDTVGVFLGGWTYPHKLLPFLPNFFPIDYVIIPVIFLLVYQRYPGWKAFLVASTIISTVLSLLFDPIMVWMNIYQPLSWQYYYSIPIFVFMVCFAKWVTMIVTSRDLTYNARSGKLGD